MISIIDSIGFVVGQVPSSAARESLRRVSVRVSCRPSTSDGAAPGWERSNSPARAC